MEKFGIEKIVNSIILQKKGFDFTRSNPFFVIKALQTVTKVTIYLLNYFKFGNNTIIK